MSKRPQVALLPDGRRLHLHHGPIDLIIEVFDPHREAAYDRAISRFDRLLDDLVQELPQLRRPLDGYVFQGPVARRMARAVAPFAERFVTPMAAVAGSIADEILSALVGDDVIPKAYVNNGGDIAFHLGPGQSVTSLTPVGQFEVAADSSVRGLATSGWRGRSHSLGIADAVSVAAPTAAAADVAATLIANAVNLPDHPAITREPANEISPDTDLGNQLVTTAVGQLSAHETEEALAKGLKTARDFAAQGLIHDAVLGLNGHTVTLKAKGKAADPWLNSPFAKCS